MPPKDYDEPLSTEALGWIAWLADTGRISEDQFFDHLTKAYACQS